MILYGIICYPTVPSSPPQSIMVTSTNPASLKVSWQPPLEALCTVPITGYMIKYFKDGAQDNIKDVKNVNVASTTTYTISGLIPCAKYSVQVAAMNDNIIGPFSEPVVEILQDSELNLHYLVHVYIHNYMIINSHIIQIATEDTSMLCTLVHGTLT